MILKKWMSADSNAWEKEIGKVGRGGAYVFLDGSHLESGNGGNDGGGSSDMAGGGAFTIGTEGAESEIGCEIGSVVTVWDGEVAGMAGREDPCLR